MNLNDLSPAPGSKPNARRVGRGIGSGWGKTSARGHKGLKARSGGKVAPGFEGGQTPLQRRLPKFGFSSFTAGLKEQIRLHELTEKLEGDLVTLETLKAADLIKDSTQQVKVILSGEINRAVTLKGIKATKGARAAIEAAGGKIED